MILCLMRNKLHWISICFDKYLLFIEQLIFKFFSKLINNSTRFAFPCRTEIERLKSTSLLDR